MYDLIDVPTPATSEHLGALVTSTEKESQHRRSPLVVLRSMWPKRLDHRVMLSLFVPFLVPLVFEVVTRQWREVGAISFFILVCVACLVPDFNYAINIILQIALPGIIGYVAYGLSPDQVNIEFYKAVAPIIPVLLVIFLADKRRDFQVAMSLERLPMVLSIAYLIWGGALSLAVLTSNDPSSQHGAKLVITALALATTSLVMGLLAGIRNESVEPVTTKNDSERRY